MNQPNSQTPKQAGRRRLINLLAFGSSVVATTLSDQWTRPVVNAVLIPAHARTTDLFQMSCRIQGRDVITALDMAIIRLTISPNPESVLPIQAVGTCNDNLVFNVTTMLDFTTGQARVTVGPLAPPPTCNPGDQLIVTLTAPTLGDITEECVFLVI